MCPEDFCTNRVFGAHRNAVRILLVLVLWWCKGLWAVGQPLRWQDVSAQYGPLPPGIQVFMSTDSIGGKPNRCFYVSAELKNRNLEFTTQVVPQARKTPAQFFEQEGKPLVVVNGTFFSFATNQNLNAVIRAGKLVAFNPPPVFQKKDSVFRYTTRSAIGIRKNRTADVAWLYTDSARRFALALQQAPSVLSGKNPIPSAKEMQQALHDSNGVQKRWRMQTAIAGGPALLHNGKIRITNREEIMFVSGENDRHPRTAMGYTADGRFIILAVEGRNTGTAEGMTLRQEAEVLQQLGCVEGLNLDGGGSSCLLINGRETIKPSDKEGQRPVPGVFIIRQR